MFGKLMSIPDELMPTYFELCTDVPLDEIESIKAGLASGALHPMEVKKRLAREIVTIYHSAEAAASAQVEFERVFSRRELPQDMPAVEISEDDLQDGGIWIARLLVKAGMASSNSEARRLVQQGAVTIDGEKITDPQASVKPADGQVLRVGKLKFARLKVSAQ
jgi:tyrosyl-tRNA synthetase